MTAPTQAQVRTWAKSQGMTVNQRGSLPANVVQAFVAAHPATGKKAAVSAARREAPRRPAATAKAAQPRRRAASATKRVAPAAMRADSASTDSTTVPAPPPPPGSVDLAGGLRTYLSAVRPRCGR